MGVDFAIGTGCHSGCFVRIQGVFGLRGLDGMRLYRPTGGERPRGGMFEMASGKGRSSFTFLRSLSPPLAGPVELTFLGLSELGGSLVLSEISGPCA